MKQSFFASAIVASIAAFSSPAQATDLLSGLGDAGHPAPPASWSGIWVAALGGYQFSNSGFDYDSVQTFPKELAVTEIGTIDGADGLAIDGLASDGFFGELQLGYDQQVSSNIVVGAFGGYNLTNADPATATVHATLVGLDETVSIEQEWGGVLGARVGVLKSPSTMFYAAGGWAFGELADMNITTDDGQDHDLNGWFAELGMETRVTGNVYLTVAGRYTDYNALNFTDEGACDCSGDGLSNDFYHETLELDHDTLAVMVGLKAKFGGF